jgi:hypothetical protein
MGSVHFKEMQGSTITTLKKRLLISDSAYSTLKGRMLISPPAKEVRILKFNLITEDKAKIASNAIHRMDSLSGHTNRTVVNSRFSWPTARAYLQLFWQ